MNEQETLELARNVYTAFNQRDWDQLVEYASPDVKVSAPSLGFEMIGHDGLRTFVDGWAGASSDLEVTIDRSFVSGDHIINQIHGDGTHDGTFMTPWGALEATGIAFRAYATELWDIENGLVSVLRSEADLTSLFAQLGYAPGRFDIERRMRQMYDTVNKGAFDQLDDMLAPDFTTHEQSPGLEPDRAGTKQFFAMMREAFPDWRMTVDQVLVQGDLAAARLRMSGTHRGDFMGTPATNKSFEVETIDIVKFRDGMAIEHWGVTDVLGMLDKLGIVDIPTPTTH